MSHDNADGDTVVVDDDRWYMIDGDNDQYLFMCYDDDDGNVLKYSIL